MSAPERMPPRIWVENHGCGQMHDGQGEVYVRKPPTDGTRLDCAEYIRADLVQALVEALRDLMAIVEDARADVDVDAMDAGGAWLCGDEMHMRMGAARAALTAIGEGGE